MKRRRADRVWCSVCKAFAPYITSEQDAVYADHPCCKCPNCSGSCSQSGVLVQPSMLPGWHPQHLCGVFCDGQDGFNSECRREHRLGPPDPVTRLGDIAR